MNYKQFQRRLNKSLLDIDLKNQYQVGVDVIKETADSKFIVASAKFSSFKEALNFSRSRKYDQLFDSIHSTVSDHAIAALIREHRDVKVTNTLIESIKALVETKEFTLDPVVESIRTNVLFDDKLDFVLEDNSTVYIDRSTIKHLNNVFAEHLDVINYMKQSSNNFISVVEKLQNKR